MLSNSEKQAIIDEILESPEFKDSKRYKELLQYLAKESFNGVVPKEITIGSEFFQKDTTFDPKEDPTVRVYINNLRKKIEHFYLTSEKDHPYRLDIPKGRYQVEFCKVEKKEINQPVNKIYITAIALSSIAIILFLFFIFKPIVQNNDIKKVPPGIIWSEFTKPGGRPTLVLLGDFFFLFERTQDGKTRNFVRNTNINSFDDFKQMVKNDPSFATRFVRSDFTFLRPSASWGLSQILPILQNSPNGYSLKLSSQFTVDDLKNNNIVFIGSFKTLYSMHKFLHIFGLEYYFSPNRFTVTGNPRDSVLTFLPQEIKGGNYEKDFAVVAKGYGPEGSTILLLLGFSDTGVLESSRAVVDTQMISLIRDKIAPGPFIDSHAFTLVIETEGFNQSIFKSQFRHFTQHPTLTKAVPPSIQATAVRDTQ
jgi:hypothetical protein